MKILSIEALLSTGFQPFQPVVRIVADTFHHHDQVTPFHRIRSALAVIGRKPERPLFQTFYIQYHAAVFSMEELHGSPASVYEDEDITQTDVMSHPVVDYSAQGIDSLAHVCLSGA